MPENQKEAQRAAVVGAGIAYFESQRPQDVVVVLPQSSWDLVNAKNDAATELFDLMHAQAPTQGVDPSQIMPNSVFAQCIQDVFAAAKTLLDYKEQQEKFYEGMLVDPETYALAVRGGFPPPRDEIDIQITLSLI